MGLTSVQQNTKQTQPVPQQVCVFMVSSVYNDIDDDDDDDDVDNDDDNVEDEEEK